MEEEEEEKEEEEEEEIKQLGWLEGWNGLV